MVVMSSLAPSKEEQEERILLLREEKVCPPAVKEQLQEKMSKLAQDFLSYNF